jgi:hypothetical protein
VIVQPPVEIPWQGLVHSSEPDRIFLTKEEYLSEHPFRDGHKRIGVVISRSAWVSGQRSIETELINELDHVYVLDHTICDPETGKPYSSEYDKYTKCGFASASKYAYTADDDEVCYDDTSIYESLTNINKDCVLPFTVEMYVSYFANLLTDSYER